MPKFHIFFQHKSNCISRSSLLFLTLSIYTHDQSSLLSSHTLLLLTLLPKLQITVWVPVSVIVYFSFHFTELQPADTPAPLCRGDKGLFVVVGQLTPVCRASEVSSKMSPTPIGRRPEDKPRNERQISRSHLRRTVIQTRCV